MTVQGVKLRVSTHDLLSGILYREGEGRRRGVGSIPESEPERGTRKFAKFGPREVFMGKAPRMLTK
jgi:hypothetical protein